METRGLPVTLLLSCRVLHYIWSFPKFARFLMCFSDPPLFDQGGAKGGECLPDVEGVVAVAAAPPGWARGVIGTPSGPVHWGSGRKWVQHQ
jgi:hypothetical protein